MKLITKYIKTMKLFKNFLIIILLSFSINSFSQNTDAVKKKGPADSYSRSSFTFVLLDFSNEKYSSMLKNSINEVKVPSKFDENNLADKIISAPYKRLTTTTYANKKQSQSVENSIVSNNFALKLIKHWWKIDEQGNYSIDLIKKRGFYNATDIDVSKADAEKRGRNAIADAGVKLIGNSYVLVLDYHSIKTMKEIYDAKDAARKKTAEKNKTEFKPVKRNKNGFKGKLTSYLFRINYNDTVNAYFFECFYENEDKIDMQKFNNIYNQAGKQFKYFTSITNGADGTQYNKGQILAPAIQQTKQQLITKLVNDGVEKALDRIESKYEQFRVKTPVFSTGPIKAKIGKKEGVTRDRRYFVWSYTQNNKGDTKAKKKGVVRAKNITDNRNDELGKTSTSTFYQVAGRKIDEGMTMQEKKDFGIDFSIGYAPLTMGGGVARLGVNIAQFINIPVSQFKIYGDIAFQTKKYDTTSLYNAGVILNTEKDEHSFKFMRFAIGAQKDFYFMRNFHFAVFAGIAGESISNWNDDVEGENLSTSMLNFGGRLGINITHSIQIEATAGAYSFYGNPTYKTDSEDESGSELNAKWNEVFKDRSPAYFDVVLRFLF